jgi:hypothetical protein
MGDEDVDEGVLVVVSGSRTRVRARCVRGDIPASVRSPNAPANRPIPCCRITIDTSSPNPRHEHKQAPKEGHQKATYLL